MPRLVYVDSTPKKKDITVSAKAAGLKVVDSPLQPKQYRDLQPNVVYMLKREQIRGTDFQAKGGISLLIASPVEHDRELQQVLGRVGRYREPCKRFYAKEIGELKDLICFSKSNNHTKRINRRLEALDNQSA